MCFKLGISHSNRPKSNETKRNSTSPSKPNSSPSQPPTKKKSSPCDLASPTPKHPRAWTTVTDTWCKKTWKKCSWEVSVHWTLKRCPSWIQLSKILLNRRCKLRCKDKWMRPWIRWWCNRRRRCLLVGIPTQTLPEAKFHSICQKPESSQPRGTTKTRLKTWCTWVWTSTSQSIKPCPSTSTLTLVKSNQRTQCGNPRQSSEEKWPWALKNQNSQLPSSFKNWEITLSSSRWQIQTKAIFTPQNLKT